jgi:2'-5' RNA ligase
MCVRITHHKRQRSSVVKLFIGVEVPEAQRRMIASTFLPECGFSFVPESRLHITLRFLGKVPSPLPTLSKLNAIEHPPFNLMVAGVGVFPAYSPSSMAPLTLWADLVGKASLVSLKNTIDATALGPDGNMAKYGGYSPHLTLAKQLKPFKQAGVRKYLKNNRDLLTDTWTVTCFGMYNNLGGGSPYEKIGEFRL